MASCFLGIGIWGMHFVGMLAYTLPIPIEYNISITLISILPSVFASYIVLSPALQTDKGLLFRSVLMGAGIGSMHFVGMMAMVMPAKMAYEPWLFSLSIIVAIVLSGIALKINDFRLAKGVHQTRMNLVVALIMGSAISGMHYIGMISMSVFETEYTTYVTTHDYSTLAQLIIFILVALSLIVLGAVELRARSLLSAKLKAVLNTVQDVVISFNNEGKIEFANPAVIHVFGYQPHDLIGKHIRTLIPERSLELDEILRDSQLSKRTAGKSSSRLLKGQRANKKRFPITLTISSIGKKESGPYVATIKDLSDIRNQEAFTQTIFDNLPIMLFVKEAEHLTFSHVNKAGEQLLGKNKDQLIGLNDFDIFSNEQAVSFVQTDRDVLKSDDTLTIEEKPVTIDDNTHYLRTRKLTIKDSNGKAQYLLDVSEDVTELKQAKTELESLHQRMSMAADAAHIGIWEWNFDTNELIWDDWMHTLFEIPKSEFKGDYSAWANSLHPDEYEDVTNKLKLAILNGEEFHAEFQIVLPSGKTRYINADGRIYGNRMIGVNFDITKRVMAEKKIRQLAQTDHLTGLANRSALERFIKQEFARVERTGSKVGCLYFDLDKFKPINDTYGHAMGDKVLIEVAKRLQDTAQKTDCVARIGGDEFVVIVTDIENQVQINRALSRLICAIKAPIKSDCGDLHVEASVGFALYPDDAQSFDELLSIADKRMYDQKHHCFSCNIMNCK
ncbi:diguanylate cyclase domain-containing protein [Pseudoalteromonas shioyasakiensis]|uniref:diguanylate cyclase domain-containing protein n=1 Tax=Pseudoalteromonas shioyasakiensis TaxID=1190813 RepID=UPI002096573C|nr:diguanylate cyclase [Pseudoalteromonas shioyasakiensis]